MARFYALSLRDPVAFFKAQVGQARGKAGKVFPEILGE
jgi:hypothetical protein